MDQTVEILVQKVRNGGVDLLAQAVEEQSLMNGSSVIEEQDESEENEADVTLIDVSKTPSCQCIGILMYLVEKKGMCLSVHELKL